jgi:hypothetical protein
MSQVPLNAAPSRSSAVPPAGPWSPRELLALGGALLVALALRLWQVEAWSFTAAELQALDGGAGLWHQPWAGSWARLFAALLGPGAGEGWWRLPTVFGSALAVPLLALVGEWFLARSTALLAAWFLAVHPGAVAAGQTLLPGAWAQDFALLAAGALVVAHRERELGWAVTAAAAALLALGLDLTAGFALSGYAAAIALGSSGRGMRLGHGLLAVLAAGFPAGRAVAHGGGLPDLGRCAEALLVVQPWWLGLAVVGVLLGGLFTAARRRALCGAALASLGFGAWFGPGSGAAAAVLLPVPIVCLFAAHGGLWVGSLLAAAAAGSAGWVQRGLFGMPALAVLTTGAVAVVLQATAFAGSRPALREATAAVLRHAGSQRLLVRAAEAAPGLRHYLGAGHGAAGIAAVEAAEVAALGAWLATPAAEAADVARAEFAVLLRPEWLALQAERAALPGALPLRVVMVLPVATAPERHTLYVLRRS